MRLSRKKVLITGGAGFIGSHLSEALVDHNVDVTIVDDLSTGSLFNLRSIVSKIRLVKSNILSRDFRRMIKTEKYDAILHLAGPAYVPPSVRNPSSNFKNTAYATLVLLDTLRKVRSNCRFIYASSAAVYGNPKKLPICEDDPTVPISPYGVAKLTSELYTYVFHKIYGLKTVSLRFFSVYGPRQKKQIIYDFITKLSKNPHKLTIIGDGTQKRDMIYVKDVVRAILKVLQNSNFNGNVYNVATGNSYSTKEIATIVARVMAKYPVLSYTKNLRPGDAQQWVVCINNLKKIGFFPKYSLEDGIRNTLKWFNSQIK